MNPTSFTMGGALSWARWVSSSKAAALRNHQLMRPLAGVPVHGATTHKALGRCALGLVAKQPILSSDHEGADRAFSGVVIER
jgi:hypothetical protein